MKTQNFFFAAAILLAFTPQKVISACLSYPPAISVITGTLVRLTFPGRPNFESVGAGDEPETGFYLQLKSPICTIGELGSSVSEPRQNVTLVQLILQQRQYEQLSPELGQSVTLEGKLLSAFTGHHHAPLLLDNPSLVQKAVR
ncbi:MAG: DUF4431 domain-containing protein [Rhodanobacter sp.]|jgi:hypothetical protein|uniref:DUF4431 domain-containing protein n=1 Tax=Rhodanobacter sp. KK11 TaxID=3083255 RepID=UPI002965D004|nr:DUF4431 domain-containing protein [Rhodanobacter sp. KK11]MDW2981171.1 DUF4431 domain-containing protein [Rhodanobacter sp. KK11]